MRRFSTAVRRRVRLMEVRLGAVERGEGVVAGVAAGGEPDGGEVSAEPVEGGSVEELGDDLGGDADLAFP